MREIDPIKIAEKNDKVNANIRMSVKHENRVDYMKSLNFKDLNQVVSKIGNLQLYYSTSL